MTSHTATAAFLESARGGRVAVPGNLTLGRGEPAELGLNDGRVSRRHALIHQQGEGEFWLVDLGSRNGTYLNDCRVQQPIRLQDGDRLGLGPFGLVFRQGEVPATDSVEEAALAMTVVDLRSACCWLLVADVIGSTAQIRDNPPDQQAMKMGRWFLHCRQAIESAQGMMNKYLGDGFLAYWPANERTIEGVGRALQSLRQLQDANDPPFRMVLHCGDVMLGGAASLGEESLFGPEVNFVFRMEKLAAGLTQSRLLSEAARQRLGDRVSAVDAGGHGLPGFDGTHRFYSC
ncbi:MAG: FHA domain-containing protein [Verrucomicrobiae bacterium]|nr:FHA domain-containing protein [Verrucomicrobiae bacterium]MCP5524287.1 FHA domain-containing protein [Verrucomicrobiales bacterium]